MCKLCNKFNKMLKTYHLKSAQDLSLEIIESIKDTFQSRSITIIVEEDEQDYELNDEMKAVLDERLQEDEKTYISGDDSIKELKKKYGI